VTRSIPPHEIPVVDDEDISVRVGRGFDRRVRGVDRERDALDLPSVRPHL